MVNKADNQRLENESLEFHKFGIEKIFPISSEHNHGIEGLLHVVNQQVPLKHKELNYEKRWGKPQNPVAVAVVGKPNAGKSSIVNALLRKERMIVDHVSGTTRDPVDSLCVYKGQQILLVDTAGIRRRGKVSQKIETFSIVSALRSIERSDVALLIIDAVEGITEQVLKIAGYVNERRKSLIIVLNKWDLAKNEGKSLSLIHI